MVVAKARAASVELFGMRIRHAAAAIVAADLQLRLFLVSTGSTSVRVTLQREEPAHSSCNAAAFLCHDLYNSLEASEANASEYLCNIGDLHAAAATAARISTFIPVWEDVSESASLVFAWIWLSGIVVLCAGSLNLFGARRDSGKVSSNPLCKGKIRFVQKDVKGSSEHSALQALIREDFDCFPDEDGELHLRKDHVDFKGKDTDGSLSLGLGDASGRVDVPVSVKQLVDKAIRSPQSVVVNQSLRDEKTFFMKGLDGHTTTHRVMISLDGKMVGMHDIAARGASGVVLRGSGSNSLTFWDSGRARHVDKNGCGWSEIVASRVGARRVMTRLHLRLSPTLLVPPVGLPRGQTL